jgi:flagellar biosynthesis/type III secretory pathway chaperone
VVTERTPPALDPAVRSSLADALEHELTLLGGLQALLGQECEALVARDAPRVVALAQAKRHALTHLSGVSAQTRALWMSCHKSAPQGSSLRTSEPFRRLLEAIQSGYAAAERANKRNAAVLKIHHASVLRGLGVLRQALGGNDLYRADGRTSGHYLTA